MYIYIKPILTLISCYGSYRSKVTCGIDILSPWLLGIVNSQLSRYSIPHEITFIHLSESKWHIFACAF